MSENVMMIYSTNRWIDFLKRFLEQFTYKQTNKAIQNQFTEISEIFQHYSLLMEYIWDKTTCLMNNGRQGGAKMLLGVFRKLNLENNYYCNWLLLQFQLGLLTSGTNILRQQHWFNSIVANINYDPDCTHIQINLLHQVHNNCCHNVTQAIIPTNGIQSWSVYKKIKHRKVYCYVIFIISNHSKFEWPHINSYPTSVIYLFIKLPVSSSIFDPRICCCMNIWTGNIFRTEPLLINNNNNQIHSSFMHSSKHQSGAAVECG